MIYTCKDPDTQKLVDREFCKKFSAIERQARMRLDRLNAARSLNDLALPGQHLEKLVGVRKGQYSIRINDQYRVCFAWKNGDAYDVKVVDYHY
jgi:proteic killer suppression protein